MTGAATAPGADMLEGPARGVELFLYYRVPTAHVAAALAAARDCQRRACAAHPGLTARLLRKPQPADGHETWMETYRFDAAAGVSADAGSPPRAAGPAGIDAALQAAIEVHARPLARWIAGPRHSERFMACA